MKTPRDPARRSMIDALDWRSVFLAHQHCACRMVRAELIDTLDVEHLGEPAACAIDAALDRADRALADISGLFVREARGADEDQSFALLRRQLRQRDTEFLKLNPPESGQAATSGSRPGCHRHPRPRGGACDIPTGTDCAGW